jgi:hypothetical protein
MPPKRCHGLRECGCIKTDQPGHPSERSPDQDREQAARDRKLDPAEIREQNDAQRHQGDDRILIGAKEETERNEGYSL